MFPDGATEQHYWWVQTLMKYTGFTMGMQTVGSIAAQVRNYWGGLMPMMAGGNLNIGDLASGKVWENAKFAHKAAFASAFRYYGGDRKYWNDTVKQLYSEGLMGESLAVGLINDLTQLGKLSAVNDDVFNSKLEKIFKNRGERVWDATKGVWRKANQIYGMTDDIFKVFTFLMEQDKYRRAYPNMSEADLRKGAIARARDIHWTYSKAPQIVQDLKKFPFIAPFVTFTTETIRTTLNIVRLAREEITKGQREGNKELEKIGWQRVRGMTIVMLAPAGLGMLAMSAAGLGGEELEDLRRFLPDWQKNSQLIITGRKGGEIKFVDVSYLDPYEVWKKPVTALLRGLANADSADEILTEAVVGAAVEALSPFASEQLLAGALFDVLRNNDASGRQVYNPQDSTASIVTNIGKQLATPFVPGTARTLDRINKAATSTVSDSGRGYDLVNEILAVPLGSRLSAINVEQALGFRASRFMRDRRDARQLFSREFIAKGTRSENDVTGGYIRSNTALRDNVQSLRRDYLAAINLGLPKSTSTKIIGASGLDRDTSKMVRSGIYRRFEPSEEQVKLAPPERRTWLRRILAETPAREALP
jgi:hypothetical protein